MSNEESKASLFMSKGLMFGMIIAAVGGSLYALSDANPNKGSFLPIQVNLILLAIPFSCMGLGYLIGKMLDK